MKTVILDEKQTNLDNLKDMGCYLAKHPMTGFVKGKFIRSNKFSIFSCEDSWGFISESDLTELKTLET